MNNSEQIKIISDKSDKVGNLLVEFLSHYNLTRLKDATREQLREFINKNKLQTED